MNVAYCHWVTRTELRVASDAVELEFFKLSRWEIAISDALC